MKTKTTLTVGIIIVLILIILGWKMHAPTAGDSIDGTNAATTTDTSTQYAGTISTSASGQLVYTNDFIGVKLTIPQGWHVGSNDLGYGTLQFFNYDEETAPGKDGFPSNSKMNKIEAAITTDPTFTASPDFPASASTTKVTIAGKQTTRVDVAMASGDHMRIYFIPIPSKPGEYLGMTIYGDTSNFGILDRVAQSVSWTK